MLGDTGPAMFFLFQGCGGFGTFVMTTGKLCAGKKGRGWQPTTVSEGGRGSAH